MSRQDHFSKSEKNYLWFFLGLLIFAFFYQLGIYPLFLEEPRRGLIALEMMYRDNIWVPTQTGDLYFRKPPFYNWLLILAYKTFGVTEFATRFFSVLSHLALGGFTYYFIRKHLGQFHAVVIAFSYLVVADILIYFSALGEIDLFYALITGASLMLIFHFGEQQKFYALFISVYILTAIGFLTKGLSSLPYTAISLLVYFIWTKEFKRLFSVGHITGILVFAVILLGYFYQFSRYEAVTAWWTTLYTESAEKATGGGLFAWLNHFVSFPLDTLKNLLPATFFLPLLFVKQGFSNLKSNRLIWYSVLIFSFNMLIYWLSTEGRSRYIYPLFPLACIVLVYAYLKSTSTWKEKYLSVVAYSLLGILIIGFGAIPFIKSLESVDHLPLISIIGIGLLLLLIYCQWKQQVRPYLIILGLFCVLRLGFSCIAPQTREKTTGAAEDKALGIELAEITAGSPLHRLGDVRMSLTIVFYLERERGEVLYQTDSFESGYYFCYSDDLPAADFEIVKVFDYHGEPIYLIQLTP